MRIVPLVIHILADAVLATGAYLIGMYDSAFSITTTLAASPAKIPPLLDLPVAGHAVGGIFLLMALMAAILLRGVALSTIISKR